MTGRVDSSLILLQFLFALHNVCLTFWFSIVYCCGGVRFIKFSENFTCHIASHHYIYGYWSVSGYCSSNLEQHNMTVIRHHWFFVVIIEKHGYQPTRWSSPHYGITFHSSQDVHALLNYPLYIYSHFHHNLFSSWFMHDKISFSSLFLSRSILFIILSA